MIDKETIKQACKDYDRSCFCSHTFGEDPSYHYQNGIEWTLREIQLNSKKTANKHEHPSTKN